MSTPAHTDGDATVAVRVMTFNIRHGEGIDDQLDLERIARIIQAADTDVVGSAGGRPAFRRPQPSSSIKRGGWAAAWA